MGGEFGRDDGERGLELRDHAFNRGTDRRDRRGLAPALLGMQRSLELTMTRHQRIEHHVRSTSEPQSAGVQPVTPKALQQPKSIASVLALMP